MPMPGPKSIGWPGGLTSNCWLCSPLALALLALGLERVVEQLLLLRDDVVQVLHHAARALLLGVLGDVPGLHALENVLELRQHALSHLLGAGLGELLDVAQHLVEVLLGEELIAVLLLLLLRHVALVLRLLGERLHVARQGIAQIVDELLDLLGRGILLQRLRERVLRRFELALGLGQVAVLDAERDLPELIDDAADALRAKDRSSAANRRRARRDR